MVCETCDRCPDDDKVDKDKVDDDKADTKVKEFAQEFHEHGIQCGLKIASLVKEIHPEAVAVVPLYRSCIAIIQGNGKYKDGNAVIHAYGDPHWLGGDIDIETLKSDRFHKMFYVHGLREGPDIIPVREDRKDREEDKKE